MPIKEMVTVVQEYDNVAQISNEVVEVVLAVEQGLQGPQGATGATGAPGGGLAAVVDDPSPELGGDLELGAYNIIGQLENQALILDGGLL